MSYTAPTADTLTEAFPAFAAVDEDAIDQALAAAALMVDDTWLSQADFTRGRLLLAAHYLTLGGLGTSSEAQFGGFQSLSIGSLSITRASLPDQVTAGELESTSFGRQFRSLLRQNKPPILVV